MEIWRMRNKFPSCWVGREPQGFFRPYVEAQVAERANVLSLTTKSALYPGANN